MNFSLILYIYLHSVSFALFSSSSFASVAFPSVINLTAKKDDNKRTLSSSLFCTRDQTFPCRSLSQQIKSPRRNGYLYKNKKLIGFLQSVRGGQLFDTDLEEEGEEEEEEKSYSLENKEEREGSNVDNNSKTKEDKMKKKSTTKKDSTLSSSPSSSAASFSSATTQ